MTSKTPREVIRTIGPEATLPAQGDRSAGRERDQVRRLAIALKQERELTEFLRARLKDATHTVEALTEQLGKALSLAEANRQRLDEHAEYGHLGIVSHELRTPLQAAIGYADLIESDVAEGLAPTERGYFSKLQESLSRLTRLVEDLLDFSRLEVGALALEPRTLDVRALVDDAIAQLAPIASAKGVALSAELPERLPEVVADELRVYQALANLVRNAVKFTPAGGNVKVTVFEDEGRLRFVVQDTGVGIDALDQARVFEPFERAVSDRHEGVGLGLAIAKRIVEAHGGAIGLDSKPGAGSTFWFTLPLAGSFTAHTGRVRVVAMAPASEAPEGVATARS